MTSPNLVTTPFAEHDRVILGFTPGIQVSEDLCLGGVPSLVDVFTYLALSAAGVLEPDEAAKLTDYSRAEARRTLDEPLSVNGFLNAAASLIAGYEPHIETPTGRLPITRRHFPSDHPLTRKNNR
jgi:hypothetical protein